MTTPITESQQHHSLMRYDPFPSQFKARNPSKTTISKYLGTNEKHAIAQENPIMKYFESLRLACEIYPINALSVAQNTRESVFSIVQESVSPALSPNGDWPVLGARTIWKRE